MSAPRAGMEVHAPGDGKRDAAIARSAVAGLLVIALLAWLLPLAGSGLRRPEPAPAVIYAPAGEGRLQWSPPDAVVRAAEGRFVDAEGRPGPRVGGWRGLLLGTPLDLNTATREDLDALPRVGPATAEAILETREALGGFRSLDDLLRVPGIGPKTLERLRPWVRLEGARSGTPPRPSRSGGSP